jgi:hypothetical protein
MSKLETGHSRLPLERNKPWLLDPVVREALQPSSRSSTCPVSSNIDLAGDSRERCLVTALARHSGD